jgi:hypothetical protein
MAERKPDVIRARQPEHTRERFERLKVKSANSSQDAALFE